MDFSLWIFSFFFPKTWDPQEPLIKCIAELTKKGGSQADTTQPPSKTHQKSMNFQKWLKTPRDFSQMDLSSTYKYQLLNVDQNLPQSGILDKAYSLLAAAMKLMKSGLAHSNSFEYLR